jgi:polysaccharide export outer membrane protein
MALLLSAVCCAGIAVAQAPPASAPPAPGETRAVFRSSYALGPEDRVNIWVLECDEFNGRPFSIAPNGEISLPFVGRMKAAGLTVQQLETELTERLKKYIRQPEVVVDIAEMRSQPVSVIGAVATPGVYQLRGTKTLVEALSMAGGLRPDAGGTVKITRRREQGPLPLSSASDLGELSVAEVALRTMMEAGDPEQNIIVKPYDVISVPQSKQVFVVGNVARPGGFPLNERQTLSVLEALALAGGTTFASAPQSAAILRPILGGPKRAELPLNVKKILAGKANDVPLLPNDILFIPGSTSKGAALRFLDTFVQAGTYVGLTAWR